MKRKFLIILFVGIIIALLSLFGCNANDDERFEYGLLVGDAYSIDAIKSKDITSIEIPSSYKGKSIKRIGARAFENCNNLMSVKIPEGVEKIDSYAFSGCNSLEYIFLPNSIKEIGSNAFKDCTSLKFNTFENGKYIGNDDNKYVALFGGLDINVSTFKVNENCIVIYEKAFSGFINLKSVDMPYSVKYIGASAFSGCYSLETFIVPNFVAHFDASWFSYCSSLKIITLGANIETVLVDYMHGCNSFSEFRVYSTNQKFAAKDGVLYSKDLKTLLVYPIAKSGDNFDIPSYVETVATYAFNGCLNLKSLTMWSTVKTLRSSAVINCNSLHTLNFNGTTSEWIALDNANPGWDNAFTVNKVHCSNGSLNRSKA